MKMEVDGCVIGTGGMEVVRASPTPTFLPQPSRAADLVLPIALGGGGGGRRRGPWRVWREAVRCVVCQPYRVTGPSKRRAVLGSFGLACLATLAQFS